MTNVVITPLFKCLHISNESSHCITGIIFCCVFHVGHAILEILYTSSSLAFTPIISTISVS